MTKLTPPTDAVIIYWLIAIRFIQMWQLTYIHTSEDEVYSPLFVSKIFLKLCTILLFFERWRLQSLVACDSVSAETADELSALHSVLAKTIMPVSAHLSVSAERAELHLVGLLTKPLPAVQMAIIQHFFRQITKCWLWRAAMVVWPPPLQHTNKLRSYGYLLHQTLDLCNPKSWVFSSVTH